MHRTSDHHTSHPIGMAVGLRQTVLPHSRSRHDFPSEKLGLDHPDNEIKQMEIQTSTLGSPDFLNGPTCNSS